MARHHDRKYGHGVAGYSSSHGRTGRVHQRMAQRRLAKQGMPGPMAVGLSRFGMAPLGLIGLVGAGILGYSLLSKRSIGGGFGLKLRSWLPLKTKRGIITAPGITPSIGTSSAIGTGLATGAPIVHNRKLPLRERVLSKIAGKPVITNYH